MTVYRIERVAEYLATHGPSTCRDIAKALGEEVHAITDILKSPSSRGRWGMYAAGVSSQRVKNGRPPALWGIDLDAYKQHLKTRRPMPWIEKRLKNDPNYRSGPPPKSAPAKTTTKAERATPKELKVDYNRKPPVYNGPHRTVWQSSSPYFKGANNEHASTAQGA